MQIPSLPTDNLYKFCAISGIVLLLFGASYPFQKSLDLNLRLADEATQIDVTGKRIEFLKQDLQQQKSEVDHVTTYISSLEHQKQISDRQMDLLETENNFTVKNQSRLIEASRNIQIRALELSGEVRKSRILFHSFLLMSTVSGLSIVTGAILALFGFRRWYMLTIAQQEGATPTRADDVNG